MTTAPMSVELYYQGPGIATETWGYTQANFLVALPGRSDKECAILLNDPAARLLATEVGIEDTPENRERLACAAGEAWIPQMAEKSPSIDSLITVSVAFLNQHPEVLAAIKQAMA